MIFDPNADFEAQLKGALLEAGKSGKRIIVEFGGDWCIWSIKMTNVLESPIFRSLLQKHFIFLRCFAGREGECPYPEYLEFPNIASIPFFILLNEKGEIIATQRTEKFEILRFYNPIKLYFFLKSWTKL